MGLTLSHCFLFATALAIQVPAGEVKQTSPGDLVLTAALDLTNARGLQKRGLGAICGYVSGDPSEQKSLHNIYFLLQIENTGF